MSEREDALNPFILPRVFGERPVGELRDCPACGATLGVPVGDGVKTSWGDRLEAVIAEHMAAHVRMET